MGSDHSFGSFSFSACKVNYDQWEVTEVRYFQTEVIIFLWKMVQVHNYFKAGMSSLWVACGPGQLVMCPTPCHCAIMSAPLSH